MQTALDMADKFSVSEEDGLMRVTVLWGIKGVDRSEADMWDIEDVGRIKWDNTFDMSSYDAQMYLYDTCVDLSDSDLVYSPDSVTCPMAAFENFTAFYGESFPWMYTNITDPQFDDTLQSELFAEKMYEFSVSPFAFDLNSNSLLYVKQEGGGYRVQYIALLAYTDIAWDSSCMCYYVFCFFVLLVVCFVGSDVFFVYVCGFVCTCWV